MWSSSRETDRTQRLPSDFKNFNPYDILEPEKVNYKKNDDESTAILIEIDDKTNKNENSVDLTLHGSFLDKVKKSEYDLLDLYQNIYVTPHEITKKDDQNSSLNNNNTNIDFTKLFEKAEHGQNLSEWKEYDINDNNTAEISVTNLIKTNPSKFDRKRLNISSEEIPHPHFYKTNPRNSNDSVDCLPQSIVIKKSMTSYNENLDNAISIKCKPLKLESDTESKLAEREPICEDEIDEFLKPKLTDPLSIKKSAPLVSCKPFNDICASSLNCNGKHSSLTIENKTQLFSKIEYKLTPKHHTHTKSGLTDLNSPLLYRLACQQESIPILHTMKMDPKVYNKRRIVKKDSEMVGFTKGPDIFEKSIVLPKILERLAERKRVFDERKIVQRKMMLDTGEKQSYDGVNVNNAGAQTSKYLSTQLTQSKTFFEPYLTAKSLMKQNERVKLTYQTPKGFCEQDKPTKQVTNVTINGFSNKKSSKLSHHLAAGFDNEPTKQVEYHKVVEFCNTDGTNKPVVCQKLDALDKPKLSLKPPDYYLEPEKSVNFELEVLMEDCNANRIIALKTRIALEQLVKTGKLPP